MGYLWRSWKSMTQTEHIVAVSLVAGCALAIVNSTIWAATSRYITHQRACVRLAKIEAQVLERLPTGQNVGIEEGPDEL